MEYFNGLHHLFFIEKVVLVADLTTIVGQIDRLDIDESDAAGQHSGSSLISCRLIHHSVSIQK